MMKNFERYFGVRGRGKLLSVFRWICDDGHHLMHRWDSKKKKWVDCPGLISVTGIGGATGMRTITKKQVDDFIRGKKGGEGSGHHDHTGLPGVWGGSSPTGTAEPAKRPPAKKPTAKKPPKKPPAKKPAVDQEMLDALWNTRVKEMQEGALEDMGLSEDDIKEMFALPGAGTDVVVYGDGLAEIIWRDTDSGDVMGTATRGFNYAGGICENKDLFINDKYQDLDFGQSLYARQKEILAEGYAEIRLYANVSIGKYAWAKQGFDYVDSGEGEDQRVELQAWMTNLGLVREAGEYGRKIDKFTGPSDYATFDVPGVKITGSQIRNSDVDPDYVMHIGKAFMLDANGHGSWDGVYYLGR